MTKEAVNILYEFTMADEKLRRIFHERAIDNAKETIAEAKSAGQTALLEKLSDGLETYRGESQLYVIGSRKYIDEDSVVKFVKIAKKGLRLDWVANFTRTIPNEIISNKIRADELKIFDNYAVLHYDPNKESWAETNQEKIARTRDPILFGLMRGSRKLYFIGDWVDEQCDLTLDQIADALGKDIIKEIV